MYDYQILLFSLRLLQ